MTQIVSQNIIRIVPLFEPKLTLAAAAPAKLTYRGGHVLSAVQIYTLFWGKAWRTQPDLMALAGKLNDFFRYIVTSPLIDAMSEYSVPGQNIGHGGFLGSTTVSSPAPRKTIKDASIQSLITKKIASGILPQPTPNTLYFVFTPPGSAIVDGTGRSCSQFCGYHNHINRTTFYAAMPYAGCAGCLGRLNAFDALTATSSHELCEAITDAIPGEGWYDDQNGEIGDICAWKFKNLGGYTIQTEWSNRANACI